MLTDLFVIVIYFLAIFCIGIYAGRKQNSLTDYALGNRSLPCPPAGAPYCRSK